MISSMAGAIVRLLEKHYAIDPRQREVYIYGCDIALYTIISTVGLLMIGLAFGLFLETFVCIAVFYLNQSLGGGYHADTHLRCFLTMAAGLVLFLMSFQISLHSIIYIIAGFVSMIALYAVPLVLHKNKSYLATHQEKMITRSRKAIVLQSLVFSFVLLQTDSRLPHAFGAALSLCALSRLTAKSLFSSNKSPV